ncbi:MAG TPA: adenylate/guanylate cyclase domain-containing protein [Actinomycetota bacterium]|nr:adenylate/guanylate cyclase domain-containing protein [Actinomycetota bacterium]
MDESPAEAPAAGLPSERRPVTILFADLVGFSTLAEHMDPEELRGLITDTFAELTAEVEKREGTVEKFIGDAVMAVFGVPQTHEDDPRRAVETALAMLEAVKQRSEKTPTPLELRIGINSGLVVSGTVGDGTQPGIMGDAVNVAARLQQAADPGEIVVSDSVWKRVRDGYEAQAMGSLEVKGRDQAVQGHRVVRPREPTARRQAPFVGRQEELALLDLLWSNAAKGNTHVVSVVGEPGVGKSRLLTQLAPRPGSLEVRITCGSERAFGPFLDLIERTLGGMPSDMEDLHRKAAAIGVDEETARLLSAFLGLGDAPPVVRMADEQQKRQVFAGVWQFLLAARGDRPALIVLDDVHWADLSSLELLGFLLERLGGIPLMFVLAYRPGFERVEQATLRASHTGIRLEPLSAEESVQLARGFLGVGELPSDLERIVATRAEGNPFFIEELLQALIELGSLAILDGKAVLARVDVDIPDSVQGTILARADRLGPAERAVLQRAAVLGRNFSTELIQALADAEDVVSALEELARSQLIVSQGPGHWTFKHALIQEVVYDTLLLRQRKEIHRKVAEALEARAGDDPAPLEVLAEHYAKAEVSEKARQYALAAGDLARDRMGFVEARARYETAFRLWGEGDEPGRLELLTKLGWARFLGGDVGGARTAYVEAEAGWRAIGDVVRAGGALATLGRILWNTGEGERASQALKRAIEVLEPGGPSPELLQAHVWLSTQRMLLGQTDDSVTLATRGLEIEEVLHLDGPRSQLLNNLGVCLSQRGDPAALDRLREARELAERSGDAEARGRIYTNLPSVLAVFSRHREAVELCERGREAMRQLGAPSFEQFIAANEASSLMEMGRYEDAEALSREALDQLRVIGSVPGIVNSGMTLADSMSRRGRYEDAARLADDVVPLARGLGGAEFLSIALATQARLEQARGNLASARQAIAEAAEEVMATPSVAHVFVVLAPAARLLPEERTRELLDRVKPVAVDPSFQAIVAEAEAILASDRDLFARAADLYASLELPYQEARCRLEAGELDRAREIIDRYGLQDGPLGARLRELEARG